MNASLVTGLQAPTGIVVSGSNLFVVNFSNCSCGRIDEYTTSGALEQASLITGLFGPVGIAVSGSNLFVSYLGDAGENIGEYTTSGATVSDPLIANLGGGNTSVSDIAVVPVPEASTNLLILGGVIGLAAVARRMR